jgi:hypothetical protein
MAEQHELLPFLAIFAAQYQRDHGLNGIHPGHWKLMEKYGAPMERFPIATNAPDIPIVADKSQGE